ncbi:hypothetical protein QYM36_015727 [Artemia franciscana]|uniref:PIN domain-containing protein n=2 Tax=Artemia franciscana TaxID=6661 RepID=A0AA88H8A4_ARTSF|nr:hypothetical protein QYM36_015727 [Artemia franciscana]
MDLLALDIVFDTNILLKHHLQGLWKLREMAERTVVKMTFLIPQIVLTELHHFSDPELEVFARKARKYIQVLENKGTGLVIETPQDAEQANSLFESKLNDDEILKCCLLMKQRGKDVVLFSDDHMLLIKARIYSLKAFQRRTLP